MIINALNSLKFISETTPELMLSVTNRINLIDQSITNFIKVHKAVIHPSFESSYLSVKSQHEQYQYIIVSVEVTLGPFFQQR